MYKYIISSEADFDSNVKEKQLILIAVCQTNGISKLLYLHDIHPSSLLGQSSTWRTLYISHTVTYLLLCIPLPW